MTGGGPAASRIFIGSSSESLRIARGVKANLEHVGEVRIWDEDLPRPSEYLMDELVTFTNTYDFGVFIFGADDVTTSRNISFFTPRDNVLLEAGMFYGSVGRRRTFLLVDRSVGVKIPSDLLGITVKSFIKPSDGNYHAATRTACDSFAAVIAATGVRGGTDHVQDTPDYAPEVWPNVEASRDTVRMSAENSRKLRILTNGGFTFFGHDSSVVGAANALDYKEHLRRVLLLVLDPTSRWVQNNFASTRRQYRSVEEIGRELRASHEILRSGLTAFCGQAQVSGEMRHHTSEPYFRMLITDEAAFVQTYAGQPGSQMKDQPVFGFYRDKPGSLYGAFHRHFNDLWHNHTSLSDAYVATRFRSLDHATEESAGAVVVSRDDDEVLHVALLMRFDGSSWGLPKGHREPRDEAIERTAVREVSEELGIDLPALRIIRKLDQYSHNRSQPDKPKLVSVFLIEVVGRGCPPLHPDAEHPKAEWFPLEAPLPALFHERQRIILAQAALEHFGVKIEFADEPH